MPAIGSGACALDTYKVFPARPCLPGANDGAAADGGAAAGSASDLDDDDRADAPGGAPEGAEASAGDRVAAEAGEAPPELAADEDVADELAADEELPNPGLIKAIDTYRKLHNAESMTPDELERLDERCEEIRERPVVETDVPHTPVEIEPGEAGAVEVGPPALTRFEKARIMGARALQLSEGAPAFIEIPESAMTSLDIAMVELDQRVIPITIRREQPNGDFQNIPIDYFKA